MPNISWRISRKTPSAGKGRTATPSSLGSFWRNTAGGISVMYALTLPALLGFTGLGVEVAYWYVSKRDLQSAADAGAIAAALELTAGNEAEMEPQALAEAVRNGFSNGAGTSIAVNNPPTAGAYTGDATAVEVVLDVQQDTMFVAVVYDGDVNVEARAVARQAPGGDACVLALNATANASVTNQGSADLNLEDCIVASNSNAEDAIYLQGSSTLVADNLWTVGDYVLDGSATMDIESTPVTQGFALQDPYADTPIPTSLTCDIQAKDIEGTMTVSNSGFDNNPTVICPPTAQGVTLHSSDQIDFQPGIYVFKNIGFEANAGAEVTCSQCEPGGDGVTFVFTGTNANNVGTVKINGGASVTLNAPSEGTNAGLLFYQDPIAGPGTPDAQINGGADTNLTGALYFPSTHVDMAGDVTGTSECILVVADTIQFTGNTGIDTTKCEDYGFEIVKSVRVVLVE